MARSGLARRAGLDGARDVPLPAAVRTQRDSRNHPGTGLAMPDRLCIHRSTGPLRALHRFHDTRDRFEHYRLRKDDPRRTEFLRRPSRGRRQKRSISPDLSRDDIAWTSIARSQPELRTAFVLPPTWPPGTSD